MARDAQLRILFAVDELARIGMQESIFAHPRKIGLFEPFEKSLLHEPRERSVERALVVVVGPERRGIARVAGSAPLRSHLREDASIHEDLADHARALDR